MDDPKAAPGGPLPGADAVLLLGFGGPDGPDDVMPFLANVTRGRGVPAQRLAEVAEHYYAVGGASPINGQNRALRAALQAELDRRGAGLQVHWGNRNWSPYVEDVVGAMAADGVRRAVVVPTSAYGSYSGCRQYREDMARARAAAGPRAPRLDKIRHYVHHAGFVTPFVAAARAALDRLPAGSRLVCTAHSIPEAMDATAGPAGHLYSQQVHRLAALVADGLGGTGFDVAWQSRSGPPSVRWLGPDVVDHLHALAAAGVPGVAVVPVGFVSDHMEVVHDLDAQAAQAAAALGLPFARAATPGTHPAFVAMLADLVAERVDPTLPRPVLAGCPVTGVDCPDTCCPAPVRPTRPAAG